MKTPLCSLILTITASLNAQAISPIVDSFDGDTLNAALWSSGGYGNHCQTVDSGALGVGVTNPGSYHHSYVQSLQNDFDFFNHTIVIDWESGGDGEIATASENASGLFLGFYFPHNDNYYPTILVFC